MDWKVIYFGSIEVAMAITCMVPLQSFFVVLPLDFFSRLVNNSRGPASFDHVYHGKSSIFLTLVFCSLPFASLSLVITKLHVGSIMKLHRLKASKIYIFHGR